MKRYSIILLFMTIWCLTFTQCKKHATALNITLYDKDTVTIKKYIEGKWKLHYYQGGICGSCKFDVENENIGYEFSVNRIKIVSQNNPTVDTTYRFITYKSGTWDYNHNILEFYASVVQEHFECSEIKNDTLVLAQPFLNNPDYSEFFLTRIK